MELGVHATEKEANAAESLICFHRSAVNFQFIPTKEELPGGLTTYDETPMRSVPLCDSLKRKLPKESQTPETTKDVEPNVDFFIAMFRTNNYDHENSDDVADCAAVILAFSLYPRLFDGMKVSIKDGDIFRSYVYGIQLWKWIVSRKGIHNLVKKKKFYRKYNINILQRGNELLFKRVLEKAMASIDCILTEIQRWNGSVTYAEFFSDAFQDQMGNAIKTAIDSEIPRNNKSRQTFSQSFSSMLQRRLKYLIEDSANEATQLGE